MAQIHEKLVEEWFRRKGYFTIRGAKFENISLKAHVSKYGQKPIYNKNLGKKF